MNTTKQVVRPLPYILAFLLAGCSPGDEAPQETASHGDHANGKPAVTDKGNITLSEDQIAAAGIQLSRVTTGGSGSIEVPATVESAPEGMQVVSAAIAGRIVALTRNLGQSIGRGQTLAVIESREVAQLKGEVEASRARLALANSVLAREQRLFSQRVSPEQDLIAARTAATEARITYKQALGQISAAGAGGGSLSRLGIISPISGQVIARSATLGQIVAADTELYRVANLSTMSLSFNLQSADAARVKPGNIVAVAASGREGKAQVSFVSPALDAQTRLVPVIATLENSRGSWRVGEPVKASIQLSSGSGDGVARVPSTAIQTIANRPMVFVRTRTGFQAVPVTLVDTEGADIIVRAGLKGDERIATTNSFTLKAELGKSEAAHED